MVTRWGVGRGLKAAVPWAAVLHSQATSSVQAGVFVGYFVRRDGGGLYLSLNQGVADLEECFGGDDLAFDEEARRRARPFEARRQDFAETGFTLGSGMDLASQTKAPRQYERAAIAWKRYNRGQLPPDAELAADLDAVLRVYVDYAAGNLA